MQRAAIYYLILFSLLLSPAGGEAADSSLKRVRQLSNEVYRLSQDMVFHGAEGHTDEIIGYGTRMIERAEQLMNEIDSVDFKKMNGEKEKIVASLQAAVQKTREAVRLGKEEKAKLALNAARKASFHAKQTRQKIQALK